MKQFIRIVLIAALLLVGSAITGVGLNPIRPLQLNQGISTKYMFYINPEIQIVTNARVQIVFPSEFDQTALASRLTCQASAVSYAWKTVPCTYSNNSVIVTLGTILDEQTNILVSQPTNPTKYSMSSHFTVCLMVSTMVTSCDKTFGKVVFPTAPTTTSNITATYPSVSSLNSIIVGQSSTYQIQFSTNTNYSSGNTVRITFPPGFQTSTNPICQMTGTYSQVITTFVWPDMRSVECQNINKTIYLNETLKIIGVFNPNFAGTFGNTTNGFKLQVLQGITTIVYEQAYIQKTVLINAGTLTGYISQANNFIVGDVTYTIYLNILNALNANNFILIQFDSSWILYSNRCSVVSGITMAPSTSLTCTNSTLGNSTFLNVSNFLSASVSNQLAFSFTVRSPNVTGTYTVQVQTANINGTLDRMSTTVNLNGTYGDYSMLSINAIVAQSNVPVSGTGPLELTFFLNYLLPQTNVLTYGKFILKIYPQIPLPPPSVNGVLKCYFYNTIPAQTCTWDTSTSTLYTLVTINTPLSNSFQYSQIPITITTEGAVNTSKIGITIADIVTRYRFELQAYQQVNGTIPTQVYFSQYIAAPIFFNVTYYALTIQANEYTHLRFEFTTPYNFTSPYVDDIRIKIQFLSGGGWASNLGYSANTIYKNFPCVFSDNKLQTLPPQYNSQVSCDLYTYLTGPHASLTNSTYRGPYILVSGFTSQMLINGQVRLELGKFLIGSSTNLATYIRFSIIQETPSMLTKFVELYYNELKAFTTATQSIPTAGSTGVTFAIGSSYINAVSNHSISFTAPSTFFAIIYEYDQISTPSFPNAFVSCTRLTATNVNWCTMLGYPVNYIVEYTYLAAFATGVSSIINITNGVYSGTFTGRTRIFSSAGLTLFKRTFSIVYTPYTLANVNTSFWMDTNTNLYLYKGAETYFYVSFIGFTNTPSNGFIRLIFSSSVQLSANPYCTSSSIGYFVNEVGLVCTSESAYSLKISNIVGMVSGSNYTIRVRLSTLLNSSGTVTPTVTIQIHYAVAADPSIVNQINSLSLNAATTNYYSIPNEFKINNPRIAFETPRVNYVGKLQFIYIPTSDVLTAYYLNVILNNHAWNGGYWSTPNQIVADPLVCFVNYIRVPCTYTLSPLNVMMTINSSGLVSSQQNIITIDTEYLVPYNGILHPAQAGQYNCFLQFLTNSSTLIQKQSFYHRVLPNRLRNFVVSSAVNDLAVENMFKVQFQIGSQTINANNHGTLYSRIYIEFPTVDSAGNPLFAKDLGGYTKTGEIMGCAFDTWDTYYVTAVTDRLKCRLIMSEVPNDPVRVEIINNNPFTSSNRYMTLWIAKVFNPATAVTSVPISIRINHVSVTTNDVYELYYDTYDVFMNTQTVATPTNVVSGCQDYNGGTIFNGDITNVNWFLLYTYPMGTVTASGYYYVLDTTGMFQPMSLEQYWNSNNCNNHILCLTFPDINYIVIQTAQAGNSWAYIYVQYGGAISQNTFGMVAKIWNQQRYKGTQTLNISPACWTQLRGTFSSVTVTTTSGSGRDLYTSRRKAEAYVSFTTAHAIPVGGSIQIVFPSSVPRIYPHCRSMTNLGSKLYAQGATYSGQIGCLVQTTTSWVITGFNAIAAGNAIIIVGLIDFPASSGYLGTGEILSYNNTHSSNIRTNGFIIDYYINGNFGININAAPSHNVNTEITLEQTLPLRINYVGPLKFKFTLGSTFNGPNTGVITVRLPGVSTLAQTGGFSYVSSKKHVCRIVQINTYQETGCMITSITADTSISTFPNFVITMTTSSSLTSAVLYRLTITTHTGTQPQGLTFPTASGSYKIDFNFDTTGSTVSAIHNHLYMQVYGTKFNSIQVTAMVTCPSNRNLIWFQVSPTTTILTTQQLIIEVPTASSSGMNLFANDLGTGLADGANIPIDILGGSFSQGFMTCRLFQGDQARSRPGKIVCGSFTGTISSAQTLFFALTLGNPALSGSQIAIPFFIYSQQQGKTFTTNYDVIQKAVHLRSDVYTSSDVANPSSQNGQLQTSGMYIDMITRNYWTLSSGDYYIMYFNFPLRNNGLVSSGCTYPGGSVYGNAYYHQNLWIIVCAVTSTAIGVPGGGYTTRNLRISSFYTPFYYLKASERVITTYGYLFSSKITSIGYITDGFPNESPKVVSNPTFSLTPIHNTVTQYAGSRDDYTITFTYTNTATVDISFTQLIAVIFPTGIDYDFPESDCLQSPSSQVEVASCYIDTANGIVWITPVIKSTYTSNMAISVTTRNLAVRNPVNNRNTNANQFTVKYYSWQNISQPSLNPISNDNYCFLITNNFASSAISYSLNPSPYALGTFNYIKYPHTRYYTDTPFSSLSNRAPFEMRFSPTVSFPTVSGINYHLIQAVFPTTFGDAAMVKIQDLQVFRPVCYLNNQRIRQCSINIATNTITMSFQFPLTASTFYHLKFSILDSRNADVDGFLPSAATSNIVLMYKPNGAGNWYYTETDQFPTLFSLPTGIATGPFRGIIAGTATYGHTIPSVLNFVNLQLTFNRTDITGLVFEIPSIDKNGNALFTSTAQLSATFMNQANGGSYPCGNHGFNAGGNVQCYILNGDFANLGVVTRIVMTSFTYVTQMNCRLVFNTPPNANRYFSVIVRAYGGAASASNPYGNQYMGFWQFNQIFYVSSSSASANSYTPNYYRCPNQSPWRNNTSMYIFSSNTQLSTGRSSIAAVTINDSSSAMTDDHFCVPTLASTNNYDDLVQFTITYGGSTKTIAYFITTWPINTNVSYLTSYGWTLNYVKCKYFAAISFTGYFFYSDTNVEVATNSFSSSYCDGYTSGVSAPVSKYFSQSSFVSGGIPVTFVHEIDFTSTLGISNFGFRNGDAMVLAISFDSTYWGTITSCSVLGGLNSTSMNQVLSCTVASNSKIYISNIAGFLAHPKLGTTTNYRVKYSFLTSGVTNTGNYAINFFTTLYANIDAYNNNYQGIFYEYNTLSTSCYYSNPSSCYLGQSASYGTFQLQRVTDTYMQVAFAPYNNPNYGTSTAFQHYFRITFNGFNYGAGCSISNVIFEMSTSTTPGTGYNNTSPITGTSCTSTYIQLYFNGLGFPSYWGGVGPAADGIWNSNEYLIFYITISPDPSARDLPSLQHEYIFVQASYNYYNGGWGLQTQQSATLTSQALAASATISTISTNRAGVTELSLLLTNLNVNVGPINTGYWVLAEFIGSTSGWTTTAEPFQYTNTAVPNDNVACKCVVGATPISISASSPFVDRNCIRRQNSGAFTNYAILIDASALQTQDMMCFFPEFTVSAGMSFYVEFKLIYGNNYPPELTTTTTKYSSLYRTQSNTLTFSGASPTMTLTGFSGISETPNFYASAATVGTSLSGTYSLTGSWGAALNTPYVYINFLAAGPIPVFSFCSDSNVFLQCRVYTSFINVMVAQLKSSSVSSFTFQPGSSTLYYPPSQYSVSGYYGVNIYVGSGNWQYSTTISRSMGNLVPINSNTFLVYSDTYGSSRASYQTNVYFAINTNGQYLYNFIGTGSQIVISWSGLTVQTSCEVWVYQMPTADLTCVPSANSLSIYSKYYDFTTTNNIFVTIGMLNPSSASTTFTMKLYSYYYSASRFYLTISTTATYTTDITYTSNTLVAKSIVAMYPFQSRISTVANAPLRIRFQIPSSSIATTWGQLVLTYSQIQYSSSHLCSIISYASYASMMQQTERTEYKAYSCTSSGSTITVRPPYTLTISSGYYYELVLMPLNINAGGCTAYGCATQSGYQQINFDQVNFIAYNNYNSPSIISQQVNKLYAYEGSKTINLQSMYILTVQPTITSLYISMNVNFTSAYNFPTHYLEITLHDLQITAFSGYAVGNIFPCQLSSNFLSINGRQPPQCRVVSAVLLTNVVRIRIENIGTLSPAIYWVTLDDVILPTPSQADNNNKFDIGITYMGPSNLKYENEFPEIFQIDNTNTTAPVTSSTYTFNNPALTGFGNPITGQLSFNWPFDTTSSGTESKIALNFNGGYSSVWSNINSVTFIDSLGTYQILWVNTKLNKFIFAIPKKGNAASTVLNISSLNNPFPYQQSLYNFNSTNMIINFYNNYFLQNKQTFNQPSFSIFTKNPSTVYINQNFPCNTIDNYPTNSIAPASLNMITLNVEFNENQTVILSRNLGNIMITFTAGVSLIRECRVMKNNTLYVNTLTTCQPYYDSTYWSVKIYDVANSDLSTGWWVQVFATFSSATVSYTSYVMASNNLVVQFQNSYTITLSAYNSSRSLPTTLSWLNNKYIPTFFQVQERFLQALSGQTTKYLKFRFTAPTSGTGNSDIMYIYLPSNAAQQPYTPVTSNNNLICQFLPAVSFDRDFSVGMFGQGTLLNTGSQFYYQIQMYNGGLTGGADYLLQISEYNTASSSFYMSTSPNRQKIEWMYNYYPSSNNWQYWDSFYIKSYCFFRSAQFLHTTTTVSNYQTITINYTPRGSLSAGSSNNEIALRLSVEARYYSSIDGGITSIYTADQKVLLSGNQFSGVVSNPNGAEVTTIQFSQYSIDNSPLRFTLTKQSAYVDNTAYYWMIPLSQLPAATFITLRYNLTLVNSPSSNYEYIFNMYESFNEYFTVADTSASMTTSITNSLRAVQTVSAVDLSVNLGSYSLPQWNTALFKINNALPGLIASIATPNDTSNYNYYYFSVINLIMAQKKNANTITTIGIGSSSSAINFQSTFGISWVWVFNNSNVPQLTNPYTLYTSSPAALTLTYLTNYASSAVTLIEGYQTQGSTAMYKATFTTPIIPLGGEIRILFDATKFSSNSNSACRVNLNLVKSANQNNILRCYRTSQGFRIAGFTALTASTSVSASFMLQSTAAVTNSAIQADVFGVYLDNSTRISLASLGTITITSGTVPPSLFRYQQTVIPYFSTLHSNNYYMIEGTFNLRLQTLSNGDYLYITDPGWTIYGTRRLVIKQNSTAVTGWTELPIAYISARYYRFTIPTNYLMTQQATISTQYIFRYTSYSTDPYYNGFIMGGTGVSSFALTTQRSGTYYQYGYYNFVPYPSPFVMTINNRYPAAGKQTVLDLSFTINVDASSGDTIVLSFDTSNQLYPMFANDLENQGTNGLTYRYLDCRQWNTNTLISNSRIVCLLYFGNNATSPPTPANLTIQFTTPFYGWSSSTTAQVLIANVMNPTTVGMNTGITANLNNFCETQQNQPCSEYEAVGYYVTKSSAENALNTTASFSSSSSLVLTTGLTHTFTLPLSASITTTDAIYIIYPENYQNLMPSNCVVTSYYCYVFPTRRWVVLYPKSAIGGTGTLITLQITSMNNPYYAQPFSLYFLVTVARANVLGDTYKILQSALTPVSYSFGNTSVSTSMTVVPTQTPSMYLRNYANTAVFTISNIFSDSRMQAIYLLAPTDVTVWDPTYCNATITNTSNFNYPLRFTCTVDPNTPQYLRLTLDSDMSTYNPAWGAMTIILRAKFTLADFPSAPTLYGTQPVTSGYFFAYSSVNATSSSSLYYMSQCSVTISISQNQVPIISTINFNTQSFANRLANVNSKEVFYLLFKPLVNVAIGSIVFTIPPQFNYPGVYQFDNCLMIGRTVNSQPNCQLSRSSGQTLVTIIPTGYDNTVKIIQIGTVSQANWFTAPALPGNFYNMNVAIYSTNGSLIAKQTRNISPVYGQSLNIPTMTIANIQDAYILKSVYDISFITGSLQIPPGAVTTATTQSSTLVFIFQNFNGMNPTNVFANDLRTGLTTGSEVGCKIFSGLTALSGMRIKCILTVGTSQTMKPTISIINYDFVNPSTTISLSFAGIQSLPATLVNTISIGAVINYNDIGSSTYLYIPTPIITVPTNSSTWMNNQLSVLRTGFQITPAYGGTNIVRQGTMFNLTVLGPHNYYNANFSTYYSTPTYQFTGVSSEFILLTFYPPTILDKNNPTSVSCALCSSVDVYYAAGMIRFRTTTGVNGNPGSYPYTSFFFTNFPTSAFAILNQTVYVNFEIYTSYQAIYRNNITILPNRTVEKCTLFNFGVVSVSSLNGGEIGVTYLFSIVTNHFVPANGALSITIPIQYGDMIANGATCQLIGFTGTNCYCKIGTPSRIDIYVNGTELSTTKTYSVSISGLQNPNIDSSNFIFIVTSYYVNNIYLALKICENQILPPSINIKPLRTCTLSWNPQFYNQKFNATYLFQLSCSDVFRGDSSLYISLPSAFSTNNKIGSLPCTSYESTTLVSPICTLQNINGVFTLWTNIDASSQSSLSLIVNLVNPINGTYSASASVTSKGTQYASSTNSSVTIVTNSYLKSQLTDVSLLNMPKEAGLMATYIFKISPITSSSFTPSNLGIVFPTNFYLDPNSISVSIANTATNNFFALLSYNKIQALVNNVSAVGGVSISSYPKFSVVGTSIYLTSITGQVSSTLWTYVFVSGIQNPSAYVYANFLVAYYVISNGFQALQWVFQNPLTYYISSPPAYISITNVNVTDFDLLYPANYSFTFSASNNGSIAPLGRNISYIIVIPTFYKSILWANTAPICKFTQLNRTSSCYSYQSQIIVTETFATNYTSLTLTISTLLNPALPTTCSTTDTTLLAQTFFIIRIIDTLSNSFLFQSSSVVDGSNCLTFSAIRIPISLQYPLIMTAGLAYNITYGLTKQASNLKVTAYTSNSGFTFSPATVNFNNWYSLTQSTVLFLRSDVPAGTYVLNFNKSESSTITYFRNILPVSITVKAASSTALTSSPTISIPNKVDSTVGYPVIIPIVFSLPSSTPMTLFMTIVEATNVTLAAYSPHLSNFSLGPSVISIQPQITTYNFTMIQGKQVVPPPLTLNFKLTSNYPIVHQLTTPVVYLCFDRDPKFNVKFPPLRVTVTQVLSACNLQDVGKAVTNILIDDSTSQSSASGVTPKIISMTLQSAASTGAVININSQSSGSIYYLCLPAGYPAITNSTVLTAMSNTIGVTGVSQSAALTVSSSSKTAQINFAATATISNLSQSTNYVFYAVCQNNLGTSPILSMPFTTTTISKGVQMTLQFTTVVANLDLVNALVQVLRISPLRIKILTSTFSLQTKQAATTVNDNKPSYAYNIVIAPDASNDIISPLTTVATFANSSSALSALQSSLPSFDYTNRIIYYELRPVYPILVAMPKKKTINLYNATFTIQLWTESNVYAVLFESVGTGSTSLSVSQIPINPQLVGSLSSTQKAKAPSSTQIKAGTDNNNTALGKYKVLKITTDSKGNAELFFTDIKPQSVYNMYITASSPLPYEPTMLWPDKQVITFNFSTLANPNIGGVEQQTSRINELSKYNPEMAKAMSNFIKQSLSLSKTKS